MTCKKPRNSPEGHIRLPELAVMLGVCTKTIVRWHGKRQGPPRIKIGRQVYYRVASVQNWMTSRERKDARQR